MPGAIEPATKSVVQNIQNEIGFVTASKCAGGAGPILSSKEILLSVSLRIKRAGAEGGAKDIDRMQVAAILQPAVTAGNTSLIYGSYGKD